MEKNKLDMKILTPKTNYSFNQKNKKNIIQNVKRKINSQENEINFKNVKHSSSSSNIYSLKDLYWIEKENKTRKKMEEYKKEKEDKVKNSLREKPRISLRSKEIAKELIMKSDETNNQYEFKRRAMEKKAIPIRIMKKIDDSKGKNINSITEKMTMKRIIELEKEKNIQETPEKGLLQEENVNKIEISAKELNNIIQKQKMNKGIQNKINENIIKFGYNNDNEKLKFIRKKLNEVYNSRQNIDKSSFQYYPSSIDYTPQRENTQISLNIQNNQNIQNSKFNQNNQCFQDNQCNHNNQINQNYYKAPNMYELNQYNTNVSQPMSLNEFKPSVQIESNEQNEPNAQEEQRENMNVPIKKPELFNKESNNELMKRLEQSQQFSNSLTNQIIQNMSQDSYAYLNYNPTYHFREENNKRLHELSDLASNAKILAQKAIQNKIDKQVAFRKDLAQQMAQNYYKGEHDSSNNNLEYFNKKLKLNEQKKKDLLDKYESIFKHELGQSESNDNKEEGYTYYINPSMMEEEFSCGTEKLCEFEFRRRK